MLHRTSWANAGSDLAATPFARSSARTLGWFSGPEHTLAFWGSLWAALFAAELVALVPVAFDAGTPIDALGVIFRLLGVSFAACGLIAWRRRPDSRAGRLMTATGFAVLIVPLLTQVHAALAQTVALELTELWTILFVAVILTFATGGRLRSGLDRVLLAAFVLPLIVLQLVFLLFAEIDGNALDLFPNAAAADAVDKAQRALFAAASLATGAVVAVRWRAASAPRRRALLPGLAGLVCLLLIAALLISDLVIGTRQQWLAWIALSSTLLVPGAFLVGLLRSRLARGGLADLFHELATVRGADLQGALGHAIGDPSLVVGYHLPESLGYADAEGRPVMVPPPGRDRSSAAVESNGRPVAALIYDASLDDDPELIQAICAAAAIALEADARLAELQDSRERIVAAGDAERRRLERNLHDGAQQRLVAIALQLRLVRDHIHDDPATAQRLAERASDELGESLTELRELARGLHPAVLDYGLPAALDALASRSAVPTQVSIEAGEAFSKPVELAAYFVACEALANAGKYAQASVAHVRVWRSGTLACIEIADDGIGGATAGRASGLRGLADRVEALEGRLRVSSPPGAGTVITAELPCAS